MDIDKLTPIELCDTIIISNHQRIKDICAWLDKMHDNIMMWSTPYLNGEYESSGYVTFYDINSPFRVKAHFDQYDNQIVADFTIQDPNYLTLNIDNVQYIPFVDNEDIRLFQVHSECCYECAYYKFVAFKGAERIFDQLTKHSKLLTELSSYHQGAVVKRAHIYQDIEAFFHTIITINLRYNK